MNFIGDEHQWASTLFGRAVLGDKRRTARLVRYAADQARHPGASTVVVSNGDKAAKEGAYRFLRNHQVDARQINESVFAYVADQALSYTVLLALEDTTTLSFYHGSVRDQLGDLGGKSKSKRRGFFVHSILLVDAQGPDVLGLIEQHYWKRTGGRKTKKDHKKRPYVDKESFKWQRGSEQMAQRLGATMSRVISVCDREADVFEYLHYKRTHHERFIVRASWDRGLADNGEYDRLWQYIKAQPVAGERRVHLAQRRGRRARTALLQVRYGQIQLKVPSRPAAERQALEPVAVSVVLAEEIAPPKGVPAMAWLLLSSEPVHDWIEANRVLDYYARRSEIEGFHKAWKSGCSVEERRFQEAANMERVAVILAHIAVRLLQLQTLQHLPDSPATSVLSTIEWRCLWHSVEGRPPPEEVPSIRWAFQAVARLGGWQDSKQTGRVGWQTIWRGWMRLQERVEGWYLAQQYPL